MQTKTSPTCLSQLALARLASQQRPALAEEAQHLQSCPYCHATLANEIDLAYAAAQEPVPATITALHTRRLAARPGFVSRFTHWQRGAWAAMAVLAVAIGAQQMLREQGQNTAHALMNTPAVTAKGSTQLFAAVKDAQGTVSPIDDLSHVATLRPGDTLQLQVQAFDDAEVTLTDADDQTVYYTGPVPTGGWLPVGVEVTPGGPLHLTVKVCARISGTPCQTWELH